MGNVVSEGLIENHTACPLGEKVTDGSLWHVSTHPARMAQALEISFKQCMGSRREYDV